MVRFALVVLVLVPIFAQDSAEELTLEEALSLALRNNPRVMNAELEVQKSEDAVATTRVRRLPTFQVNLLGSQLLTPVDFRFRQGVFGTFPGIGPIPGGNTQIRTPRRPNTLVLASAAQPLSQLYRIGLGVRLQELAREAARESLRLQQHLVANQVRRTYYGILQTESALEALDEAIKLYTEVDRVVADGLAQQVALQSDSLETKARLAKAQHEAVALRNSLGSQKENLNQLLGRDVGTEFRVKAVSDSTEPTTDLAAARAGALRRRPELKEAKLRLQQAQYDRSVKKSEYLPDVSLMVHYLSPFSIEFLPKNVAAAGLLLSWDVFDWGRKKRELAIKSKTIEQVQNAVHETEAQILVEVDSRYRKLEEARTFLQVMELAREAAREKVHVAMNRYTQQALLLKDVLQTQTLLAEADHQYRQALLSFWTAKADLDKAVGER